MASTINANTSGGLISTADTSGVLQLQTASTTALTITSSQNIGIGTTSVTGGYKTQINGNLILGTTANPFITGTTSLTLYGDNSAATGMTINTAGNVGIGTTSPISLGAGYKSLTVNDTTGGGVVFAQAGTQRGQVFAGGVNIFLDASSASGNINFRNTSTGASTVINTTGVIALNGGNTAATGVGIAFPASQSASSDANTLDDYEEGTFTPVIEGTTTAGTASYSQNDGRYTKIGRLVFIETYVAYTSGTGTGNLRLGGLPFTSANANTYPGLTLSYFENIVMTAGNFPMLYVNRNSTTALFYQGPTGGGANSAIPYDAAGAIQISGCYTV